MLRRPPVSTLTDTLFPATTLFRSSQDQISRAPGPGRVTFIPTRLYRRGSNELADRLDKAGHRDRLGDIGVSAFIPDSVVVALPGKGRHRKHRSEERRVGKECVSTGRSRWSPSH